MFYILKMIPLISRAMRRCISLLPGSLPGIWKDTGHIATRSICMATLLVLPLSGLSAEVLYLRNNSTITGRITRQTLADVEVTTAQGAKLIPKKTIRWIKYVPMTRAERAAAEARERKLAEERRLQRLKLEREIQEKKAREEQLAALEEKIHQEKLAEAKERAERAAALREFVGKKLMEKPSDEPISYKDFAWRSLVIPGWGHFYLNRPIVGSIYTGGGALLLINAWNRRQVALAATDENHAEVLKNLILTTQPQLAPQAIRLAYAYEANRRAFTDYQHKIDNYNYSLYLLEVFYGAQLLHIIYNGFAWEKGLLIVDGSQGDRPGVTLIASVGPEFTRDSEQSRRTGTQGMVGMTLRF